MEEKPENKKKISPITQNGLMKDILSSKFKELQTFTDKRTGVDYMTMTLETWEYVSKHNDIIDEIKEVCKELHTQDNKSTNQPMFIDYLPGDMVHCHCMSFFETDIKGSDVQYAKSNFEAPKMNKLRDLLIKLSKGDSE